MPDEPIREDEVDELFIDVVSSDIQDEPIMPAGNSATTST